MSKQDKPIKASAGGPPGTPPSSLWLFIGAGVMIAFLLANIALMFRNVRQLNEDFHWVAHTYQVINGLENILSLAKDAETGQRGYVITGDPRYLEPYNSANGAMNQRVEELQRLTSDNPDQQARFPELRERVAARSRTLDELVALRKNGGFDAARQAVLTDRGKTEMDDLRAYIGVMTGHERSLLRDRDETAGRAYRVATASIYLSGLLSLTAVGAFLALFRRHLAARAKSAAVIAEQAERLRTTLASIGDAVIATDAGGRITMMNGVAESLTGWKQDEAEGLPLEKVFNIVNENTRKLVESPVTKALREGVIVGLANHTVLIAKDGVERPIDDSAAPIRRKEGELVGCVLVFRDITERKEAEDQLRELARNLSEADRRKNVFLATLSHELRNPLAPISNALQVMRLAGGADENVRFATDIMGRQIGQMVRLVDDLLDLSRISQGRIDLRLERVELAQILHQAVETSRPVIDCDRHELKMTLPHQPVFLHADAVRLAQVFGNLINNSCKYSEPGGLITVVAEPGDEAVVISVKDTGIGIPPEMLTKIFEMFTQVDRSLERSQGGLGIGLSLARQLVEMHGGSVSAFSEGRGRGSEFVVRLPVLREPKRFEESSSGELVSARARRFLVVDDNRDSAVSLAMWLKIRGNETRIAHDGLEALAAAESYRPDVALLDIGMPKLNGYEVARGIRREPWGKDITLVALTGWGQENDRRQSSEAGFDGHMVKPVDFRKLMALLDEIDANRSSG